MSARPRYVLSVHRGYACRHANACCTAGWTIPVEAPLRLLLGSDMLTPQPDGSCRFLDRSSRLCAVHRDHGVHRLPAACGHFPRRARVDEAGVFITLSHFCPTAAALLFSAEPLRVVRNPDAFPPDRAYDGLDATGEWPPLVKRDLLFDFATFAAWEHFMVQTFADGTITTAQAFAILADTAEYLRAWTPEHGSLVDYSAPRLSASRAGSGAAGPLADGRAADVLSRYAEFREWTAFEHVRAAVPAARRPAADVPLATLVSAWNRWVEPTWTLWQPVRHRYLAAKAFGSWSAYEGRGIRTTIAELITSDVVLKIEAARVCHGVGAPLGRGELLEAVRQADWWLMHLVERAPLVRWLGASEVE